ncbi:MAG: cyclase family protein [Spirochaetaceae bacterium]|jgi:kynurenine formamidase|nr:cyclase family protein [Spirochaetaceae bacterium]
MGKIIDLTAPMFDGAPTMPMDPKMSLTWHCSLETLGYNLSRLTTSTHQGTHMDAARHFYNKGECIDEISLDRCVVRAIRVDLTYKKPGESIEPADLLPYEKLIDGGAAVLLHTGWDKRFPDQSFFSGFPFVSKTLADWFVEKRTGLVGMDMPTPNGTDWKYVHVKMLGAGIIIVEGLAGMEELPLNTAFTFYSLPLKLQGRDGSPIRAIAILD